MWHRERKHAVVPWQWAALAAVALTTGFAFDLPFGANLTDIDRASERAAARIRVSAPQVYTRQQLINDRLTERAFIDAQSAGGERRLCRSSPTFAVFRTSGGFRCKAVIRALLQPPISVCRLGSSVAPLLEIRSTPRDDALGQSNRRRELLISHEPIDRRASEAGQAHHGTDAKQKRPDELRAGLTAGDVVDAHRWLRLGIETNLAVNRGSATDGFRPRGIECPSMLTSLQLVPPGGCLWAVVRLDACRSHSARPWQARSPTRSVRRGAR